MRLVPETASRWVSPLVRKSSVDLARQARVVAGDQRRDQVPGLARPRAPRPAHRLGPRRRRSTTRPAPPRWPPVVAPGPARPGRRRRPVPTGPTSRTRLPSSTSASSPAAAISSTGERTSVCAPRGRSPRGPTPDHVGVGEAARHRAHVAGDDDARLDDRLLRPPGRAPVRPRPAPPAVPPPAPGRGRGQRDGQPAVTVPGARSAPPATSSRPAVSPPRPGSPGPARQTPQAATAGAASRASARDVGVAILALGGARLGLVVGARRARRVARCRRARAARQRLTPVTPSPGHGCRRASRRRCHRPRAARRRW